MSDLYPVFTGDKRPHIVSDLLALIDSTVAGYKGISGMAIKTTLATVKKADESFLRRGVNSMVGDFATAMQQPWDNYQAQSDNYTDFADYLQKHKEQAMEHLLATADKNLDRVENKAISGLYSSMRGKATQFLEPALPGLGHIVQRHAE